MKYNHKGFTLIELLAVIIVIGVIISLVIPTVNNIMQKNRAKIDRLTYNKIAEVLKQKYNELGQPYDLTAYVNPDRKIEYTYWYNEDYTDPHTELLEYDGNMSLKVSDNYNFIDDYDFDKVWINRSFAYSIYYSTQDDTSVNGFYYTDNYCIREMNNEITENYINISNDWKYCHIE